MSGGKVERVTLLTVHQVADRLGIAVGTVYNLVHQRRIPYIKIFGNLRFDLRDIDEIIRTGRITPRRYKDRPARIPSHSTGSPALVPVNSPANLPEENDS